MVQTLKRLLPFGAGGVPSDLPSFADLGADIHSHLIPGIDDGAKTMEEAVGLVQSLSSLGYRKLITTPHVMADTYKNTPEKILEGLESLRLELSRRGIDVAVEAAAEYYLDEGFLPLLERGEILTFGGRYVLFETSYVAKPLGLSEMIYEMLARGYKPVLAHPERYLYLHDTPEEYLTLKNRGVLFQINLGSLAGYYTQPVKKTAQWIIERGLADFVGSDVHKMRHVEFVKKSAAEPIFQKLLTGNALLNATLLE